MKTVRRALHVIPSMGPLRGGPSTLVRSLALGLCREGVDTHVVTTDDNGAGTLPVTCGVPVVQEGVTYWHFRRQTRFYTVSWPLGAWLARHTREYDIVHIHALFSFATLPAAFWAHRQGVPYIVRPLGTLNEWGMKYRRPWLKRMSFRMIESRILKYAALIHYTSEQERIEAGKMRVTTAAAIIPNPVSDCTSGTSHAGHFRARYPKVQNHPLVLFLSRLDRIKGLDLLLHAFARVRARVPGATLVIAGSGDEGYVASLRAMALSLGMEADVVWTGFLDDEAKQSALADADVFVLPSYSESFGNAVAEAMAAGLPVVVSERVGLHAEILAAGAGLVVRCEVEDLASSLTKLLGEPSLRASMGRQGKELVRRRYSSTAVTRQLVGLYNGILN